MRIIKNSLITVLLMIAVIVTSITGIVSPVIIVYAERNEHGESGGGESGTIYYRDAAGESHPCTSYTEICDSSTNFLPEVWSVSGWYAVTGNVVISGVLDVSSPVHLILCDGVKMECKKGIRVQPYGSFTIYGQSKGTGELITTGTSSAAGIGGGISGEASGTIIINGGTVTATGGTGAAGIGCSVAASAGGTITINGGTVTAIGSADAAGIGGGSGVDGGTITINGGTVIATGGTGAAGIGGGMNGAGGTITINGGRVDATGTTGIGGGNNGAGGTITLGLDNARDFITANGYNGTVAVKSGKYLKVKDVDRPVYSGTLSNDQISEISCKTLVMASSPSATKYSVTVNNGTGDGSYEAGTSVTIKADAPPEGQRFKEWTWTGVDDLTFVGGSDKNTETATITMPANDVTLEATYEEMVAAPTFDPAGGTYNSARSVTISCATYDADIYYTTDGTAPTTSSTKYSGAISVSKTTTIKAIAVKTDMNNSAASTATYTIAEPVPEKINIASATVSGIRTKSFAGKALTQSPAITLDDKTLQKGIDYTLSYENNVNVGTATVIITGIGSYTGTIKKIFTIAKAKQTITASDITKTTSDTAFSIRVKTSGNGQLSYKSGNTGVVTVDKKGKVSIKSAGSTTITITASETANYKKATKKITVTVTSKSTAKQSFDKAVITGIKNKTYTGKAITQSLIVKLGGKKLKAGTDYTVAYKNNKNAGTATITITGKGNYKGTATANFNIKKAVNSFAVKPKKTTYIIAYSKLSKKDQGIKETKIYNVTRQGQGKLSYAFSSAKTGKKNVKTSFNVDKKTGKLTVKKGLKKGTYSVGINVTAAGDKNHKKVTKNITISLNVK